MIYTTLTKKALNICYTAHHGQLDKGGVPYVFHPLHLAEQMEDETSVCTALLHDVVEDGHVSLAALRDAGFPEQVVEAVRLLTRPKDMDYMDYIRGLAQNELAARIKLADLEHNMDMSRLTGVREKDMKRVEKYKEAVKILGEYHGKEGNGLL
ncbi:MAG: HD domain-containing protein [Clostridium sp.]|nr:HD domain-containing protein [Clostridium sp.]MCM1399131.1 HD domain-containing protein [Clostridium sp.]MCM1459523.1 HD domain-containing protein [Bacteroides sp.]